MTDWGKGLIGAAEASLVALVSHSITGEGYVAGLEADGQAALAQSAAGDGFTFAMQRDPLSRVALVDGPDDADARGAAEQALMAVPGISSVRWADADEIAQARAAAAGDAGEAGDAAGDAAARSPQVAGCQERLDAALDGKSIRFRSGSAYLSLDSLAITDSVAAVLGECGDVSVTVEGHTDARGSEAINRTMSQERADRVAAALVERGVAQGPVSAVGLGASQPVMEGTSAEANEANRRIVFTLGDADAPAGQGE